MKKDALKKDRESPAEYVLDDQIGYKLRIANQKHLEIFAREIPDVTPTQFAVLNRLLEVGQVSQNHLGRLVGTDAATTKGVVSRLSKNGFVDVSRSTTDKRRLLISLTDKGISATRKLIETATRVTAMTTAKLTPKQARKLNELLAKL
ncbi:MAG: DNA-binding MarR family transcriptional regulator [Paracoccaceae bacterium]|jgi:DNA-binding MarR family transcriptional regulator